MNACSYCGSFVEVTGDSVMVGPYNSIPPLKLYPTICKKCKDRCSAIEILIGKRE